ncbi:MAG TPA: hypothetical protein V6D12_14200 [Candidatus Obscuribacterales bacterium]
MADWVGMNDQFRDIGSALGGYARQKIDRRQTLEDAIALATAKAQIERQFKSPYEDLINFGKVAEVFDGMGIPIGSVMGGNSSMGASLNANPSTPSFGQSLQNPAAMTPFATPQAPVTGGVDPATLIPESFERTTFGGFRPKSYFNPEAERQKKITEKLVAGPGADLAGRVTLAKESLKNIKDIKNILFPKGDTKSFKRFVAFGSNLPGPGKKLPFNKNAQDVHRKMGAALSGRLLIQTGVAASPGERENLISQFAPNAFSNPDSAMNALNELETFYKTFLGESDPETRFGQPQNNQNDPLGLR